jgi:hypothetical protein
MKPTVGRIVHYYGNNLKWHRGRKTKFTGPFAAIVVDVNQDDGYFVSLNVQYPSATVDREQLQSEIVENVHGDQMVALVPGVPEGFWTWPPRDGAPPVRPNKRASRRASKRTSR